MKLFASIYTDEDISGLVAVLLRSRGFDVLTVQDAGNIGKSDQDQLEFAAKCSRCLLTHNRVDFERLNTQYFAASKSHSGIIVTPQRNPYDVARRVSILLDTLTIDEFLGQLFYV